MPLWRRVAAIGWYRLSLWAVARPSWPVNLANVLSERRGRTKLGLSKYAAEAAERAGESDGNLALSRNVRDVAAVHSTLWPEDHNERGILNLDILTGKVQIGIVAPQDAS
jgi:hypothetical protein